MAWFLRVVTESIVAWFIFKTLKEYKKMTEQEKFESFRATKNKKAEMNE